MRVDWSTKVDIDTGNQVIASFDNKQRVVLAIDARINSDASCNQADSGWWAFDIRTEIDYFVSDELIVYKSDNNMETFDIACGTVVDVLL